VRRTLAAAALARREVANLDALHELDLPAHLLAAAILAIDGEHSPSGRESERRICANRARHLPKTFCDRHLELREIAPLVEAIGGEPAQVVEVTLNVGDERAVVLKACGFRGEQNVAALTGDIRPRNTL
jgi:hypothetical protein